MSEPEFSLADGFMATARRKADVIPGDEAVEVTDQVADQVTDQVTVEVRRLLMAFMGRWGVLTFKWRWDYSTYQI